MTLKTAPSLRLRVLAVAWLLLALFTAPLLAGKIYITTGRVDGVALLAPPPPPGSAEERADLASVRFVVQARTAADVAAAEEGEEISIHSFALAFGESFQPAKYPKLEILMETVKTNVNGVIREPKIHWQRPRPYVLDPSLLHGSPEQSFSYPSGHSTRGTMQALIMAEVFPERRDALLKCGRQLGWDRTVLGKHYPTDINAGRVLGQAIFRELMKNRAFRRDLAAARAEVLAADKE